MTTIMKTLPALTTLATTALLFGAAESAQACFMCTGDPFNSHDSRYCTDGHDFAACTTRDWVDPNTCESYQSCENAYACTEGSGDPDYTCRNSTCDPNQWWNIRSTYDMYDYMCYHYGSFCSSSHSAE
jgi:hypothetical protein